MNLLEAAKVGQKKKTMNKDYSVDVVGGRAKGFTYMYLITSFNTCIT